MKKILLMIPAYNEAENIGALLKGMKDLGLESMMDVLVIDDCSADSTSQIVEESGFKVIRQVFNMGYGAALQTAYKYAVEKNYDYLLQMDADGQHDLCNVKVRENGLLFRGRRCISGYCNRIQIFRGKPVFSHIRTEKVYHPVFQKHHKKGDRMQPDGSHQRPPGTEQKSIFVLFPLQ